MHQLSSRASERMLTLQKLASRKTGKSVDALGQLTDLMKLATRSYRRLMPHVDQLTQAEAEQVLHVMRLIMKTSFIFGVCECLLDLNWSEKTIISKQHQAERWMSPAKICMRVGMT